MKRMALIASLLMLIVSSLLISCATEQPVEGVSVLQTMNCMEIADRSLRNQCLDANH